MNPKRNNSYIAYQMLCACTAILLLSFIAISVVVGLSERVIPPEAEGAAVTTGYIFKNIILFAFCLSALTLWFFNWFLIFKTWPRRGPLLNCILIFVQIFGTFINYVVFFIMFYKYDRFPNESDAKDFHR